MMIFVPSSQGILNQLGDAGIPAVRINQNLATPSSQEHPDVVVKDLIYACQKDGMGPDSMPRNWRLEPINLVKLVVHDQNPQKVAVGREIPGHFKEIQVGDMFLMFWVESCQILPVWIRHCYDEAFPLSSLNPWNSPNAARKLGRRLLMNRNVMFFLLGHIVFRIHTRE